MNLLKFLTILLALTNSIVMAGDKGNGGDVIVCFIEKGDEVKSLSNGKIYEISAIKYERVETDYPIGHTDHRVVLNLDSFRVKSDGTNDFSLYHYVPEYRLKKGPYSHTQHLRPVIVNGKMRVYQYTPGRTHKVPQNYFVKQVFTREYFKLSQLQRLPSFLKSNSNATYEEALMKLHNLFDGAPWFKSLLVSASDELEGIGPISKGMPYEALKDVNDQGIELPLPNNCIEVQAVVREGYILNYTPQLWSNLGRRNTLTGEITSQGIQQALLQLHEEIYYIGSEFFEQKSSIATQNLIFSVIKEEDLTPEKLEIHLKKSGFSIKST